MERAPLKEWLAPRALTVSGVARRACHAAGWRTLGLQARSRPGCGEPFPRRKMKYQADKDTDKDADTDTGRKQLGRRNCTRRLPFCIYFIRRNLLTGT